MNIPKYIFFKHVSFHFSFHLGVELLDHWQMVFEYENILDSRAFVMIYSGNGTQ